MNCIKRGMIVWICWLCAMTMGQAAFDPLAAHDAPPAPEAGILDPGRLLEDSPETFKRISTKLRALENRHGYKIFLVTERVVISETPMELAERLRQAWLPKQDGLVVTFEADTHNVGAGRHLESHKQGPGRVPSFVATDLLNRALLGLDPALPHPAYLEALVDRLTAEFDAYFVRRATPPPPERNFKVELVVIGTLSLMGLLFLGIRALIRFSSMEDVQTFHFPEVTVAERLGAPSGGAVTARRFVPAAQPHEQTVH